MSSEAYDCGGNSPPLPAGPFDLVLADPPWQFQNATTPNRRATNHYPVMTLAAICALPVAPIMATHSVLYLWTTSSKIAEACQVIDAWGFRLVSSAVWVKAGNFGGGSYFRQRHELLLVAKRGRPPCPAPAVRPDSVMTAPRGKHSAKPLIAYQLLERMYPKTRKLELFARGQPRPAWTAWGNEVTDEAMPA
jgi:N6-adenosine-specific RNA methylase IME4